MTLSALGSPIGRPTWSMQRASWYLVALHVPFVVAAPLYVLTRQHGLAAPTIAAMLIAAGCLATVQLRHSLAAARGTRPAGWKWSCLAIFVLAYLPGLEFGFDWTATSQMFVVGSGMMLLSRRLAAITVIGPIIIIMVWSIHLIGFVDSGSVIEVIVFILYDVVITLVAGFAMYGSTRLVGVLDQLNTARTELAELAVGRERLRVSRDLHDLLGHSLSAVSLKGDLAIRLLAVDTQRARAEIESLIGIARTTLRDMRAVAHDQHAVSLASEIAAAAAVLEAAGVKTHIDIHAPDLPTNLEIVLAWAVREAATNILRHSDANECAMTMSHRSGTVRLEIINDGVAATSGDHTDNGHGLAGLSQRAQAVSGVAHGSTIPGGRYRLLVEIPAALV